MTPFPLSCRRVLFSSLGFRLRELGPVRGVISSWLHIQLMFTEAANKGHDKHVQPAGQPWSWVQQPKGLLGRYNPVMRQRPTRCTGLRAAVTGGPLLCSTTQRGH